MKSEVLKSEVLLEDSEYNICCFFFSSQENDGVGIINGAIKCRLFVEKYLILTLFGVQILVQKSIWSTKNRFLNLSALVSAVIANFNPPLPSKIAEFKGGVKIS